MEWIEGDAEHNDDAIEKGDESSVDSREELVVVLQENGGMHCRETESAEQQSVLRHFYFQSRSCRLLYLHVAP